ncbi:MAG: hypothetical protein B5M54_04900 [Candidatus Aminicenantes bacterium 4484_214]|nr:MAG: hypothetical protein B5M54_04900 [Candidatus Aminicenantes bacterium 4484_214]
MSLRQLKGRGSRQGRRNQGQGRGQGGGAGPGGNCVCPACGHKIPHRPGIPCNQISCPQCGAPMIRE